MPGVVHDEQVVLSVVLENELRNVVVELELRLLPNVQLDDIGVVVEARAEKALEFLGLGTC